MTITSTSGGQHERRLGAMRRFIWSVPLRLYALALILLVSWVTWRAFRYLLVSLLVPAAAPERITSVPRRLGEQTFRVDRDALQHADEEGGPLAARSPLAHYHRLGGWIQPDPGNNCTTSGCHSTIPHKRRKEVRAFLNMHSTSMHCGVCHFQSEEPAPTLVWYDLRTGEPADPPAVLQALKVVDAVRTGARPADEAARGELAALVDKAAEDADEHRQLRALADHFAAVRAPGNAFASVVEAAAPTLQRQFRGEYGRKLARRATNGEPILAHPGTEADVASYLARAPITNEAERKAIVERIHPLRRAEPLVCGQCHTAQGGLVDFRAAGYPEPRVAMLVDPVIFQMIEHISGGREFHLPGAMGRPSGGEPAEEAPQPAVPPAPDAG